MYCWPWQWNDFLVLPLGAFLILSPTPSRQEHREAISPKERTAYCTFCWLSVSPACCLKIWAITGHYFPGLKFLRQYNSLKALVWFLSLAFCQLIRSCRVMVFQSKIGTGHYCLLAIDDLPFFIPQLNCVHPDCRQPPYRDIVNKKIGLGGEVQRKLTFPYPSLYSIGSSLDWSNNLLCLVRVQGWDPLKEVGGGESVRLLPAPFLPLSLIFQSSVCW